MTKIEPNNLIISEEVKSSSSDNIYEVNLYDNCISCNCPAGGKKNLCKHMVKVIHNNAELLQDKVPEFYNKLTDALVMKNDKNRDVKLYKSLLEDIIYVNRKIAEKAHENAQVISKHPERTESIRFRVTEIEKSFLKTALYDFRKYGKYNGTWDKNYEVITISLEDVLSDYSEYLD